MFTEPSTEIIILSAVPIDKDHTHTLYFETASEQEAKFKTFATTYPTETGTTLPVTFYNQQYQRINKNTIKVAIKPDYIYESNYLMFKNSAHSDKWYYAFINNVEYDNENVAIVNYTIDVIQTYMFDYEFGECLIERQHSTTDVIGDNIVPENLDTGDMLIINRKYLPNASLLNQGLNPEATVKRAGYGLLIFSTFTFVLSTSGTTHIEYDGTNEFDPTLFSIIDNIPIGCGVYYVDCSRLGMAFGDSMGLTLLNSLSKKGKAESIIGLSIISEKYLKLDIPYNEEFVFYKVLGQKEVNDNYTFAINNAPGYEQIYTQKPKNNKIYTYPFTYIELLDNTGEKNILRAEYFTNLNNIQFYSKTSVNAPNESVLCYPRAYNNVPDNYQEGITSNLSTLCSYSYNLYENWYSQHQGSLTLNALKNVALPAISAASVVPMALNSGTRLQQFRTFSSAVNNITQKSSNALDSSFSTLALMADMNKLPIATRNVSMSSLINLCSVSSVINVQTLKLRDDYLNRIDQYFTMFGYAQGKIGLPNIHAREGFTYVKTANCQIHAKRNDNGHYITSFNSDVETEICDIYNSGITFWVYADEVGDYSVSNDPI